MPDAVRQEQRGGLSGDQSHGRVPTLVDGDFVLWESNSVMRYLCMAYGQDRRSIRRRHSSARPSTAGWTGRCRPCSRSAGRCSGRWCERRRKSATWSRSRRMPTPRQWNGGSSMRSLRRGASWKAINSPSPTSRSGVCPALVRRRRHDQTKAGKSRTLVRTNCGPGWFSRVCQRPGRPCDELVWRRGKSVSVVKFKYASKITLDAGGWDSTSSVAR